MPDPASLSFFDVLDRPAAIVRERFRTLYPIALLGSLLAVIPTVLQQLAAGPAAASADPAAMQEYMALVYGAGLLSMVVWGVTMLAVFDGVRRVFDDQPAGIGACYRAALRPRSLISLLLPGLALLVGWLMCCVPGLVLSVLFAFVAPIIVDERPWPADVLRRSVDLVIRGSASGFGPAVGVLFVGALVTYSIQSIHTLPAMVAGWITAFSQIGTGEMADPAQIQQRVIWINVMTSLVAGFVVPVGYLYVASAVTTLYRKHREQRDGGQLARDLDARLATEAGGAAEGR